MPAAVRRFALVHMIRCPNGWSVASSPRVCRWAWTKGPTKVVVCRRGSRCLLLFRGSSPVTVEAAVTDIHVTGVRPRINPSERLNVSRFGNHWTTRDPNRALLVRPPHQPAGLFGFFGTNQRSDKAPTVRSGC
jgi:hypothetical protein